VQIKLTNKSLRALANVVVIDRVGGGAVLESASLGGQTFNGIAQWIVPMLAANETRVFEAVVRCPQGGRVVHQVRGLAEGVVEDGDLRRRGVRGRGGLGEVSGTACGEERWRQQDERVGP
jgi:hypothetical protein